MAKSLAGLMRLRVSGLRGCMASHARGSGVKAGGGAGVPLQSLCASGWLSGL